ncbi:MAG: 23S rRNA (uracil(1939)-C(5))-methyltransferase RlmD [Planctomycetota bacterium]|jgi:23S rRNA (uracil1939-C5)-methyltransferase|nr:23S rRNA (uracil(1939)-C(5))-methyltransferase RlmD [Planctomycetota bacterium]MDP6762120.1 23S rRNA (uracil(1939)-C(5))-methyltransferase RlmD [Planctomycetota bacterium]MDP6989109.1 23S rRNA (uracil(1939)-C(5))-methyltransferase RlmD [Planctomycetota bacterium]
MDAPSPTPVRKPRHGDDLVCDVDGYDRRGRAVGSAVDPQGRGFRVRLRGAVPGDRVRVSVVRRRGERIDGAFLEHLERGPDAVAPRCRHASTCGGCSFQDLAYQAQLRVKHAGVVAALARHGIEARIDAVLGDPEPWHYRNKMEFTFSDRRWIEAGEPDGVASDFALGLHVPGRHDKVMDVDECAIAFPEAAGIVRDARELALAAGLSPWNLREHSGLLRHLVLRKAHHSGEVLAYLVTSAEAPELVDPFAERLCARQPAITTCVQGINTRPASVAIGECERVLVGSGFITERLAGLDLRISPASFFQTNTRQAELLARIVREEALGGGSPPERVFDLCSGGGLLSLLLASGAGEVIGIEVVPAAVADARANARRNGIDNVTFVEGDVARELPAVGGPPPRVCVADPPRAGLHADVLAALFAVAPRRIVYVACDLSASGRDVGALVAGGYAVRRVRPIDLFPHTPHVECVLTMERHDPS